MLKKFSVKNFKTFEQTIELDLTAGKYSFSDQAIKNGLIKNAVIYGENGAGKSNLNYAIMDITTHLTDFGKIDSHYRPYLNFNSDSNHAEFMYEFMFDSDLVTYKYKKNSFIEVYDEEIYINDVRVIFEDFEENYRFVNLKGAETLNIGDRDKSLSFVKYIFANTKLDKVDKLNQIFLQFRKFVEGMLFFSSGTAERNIYQGFKSGSDSISATIVDSGNLKKFESFLNDLGIHYELVAGEGSEGKSIINVKFKDRLTNILNVASHGTTVLMVFYFWLIQLEQVKFLVIDEFDAFYHNEVSEKILSLVRDSHVQSVFTTHNTTIMTNDLLRPDCYFIIKNNQISSLPSLTKKELRFAHNLEKMYNAGKFNEE